MALKVEVALIGDPNELAAGGVLDEAFYNMPYGARRRVQLEIQPEDTLSAVLGRAAELMGLRTGDWMGAD